MFENKEEYEQILKILSDKSLDMYFDIIPRGSPIVFSHLDLSPLNIMINKDTKDIYFIDFEFAGYGYRSFDIATMLNELKFNFLFYEPPYYQYIPENEPSNELIKQYVISYGEGIDL